jgi:3-mercaptopyruvate sulfurtransferase SseA
VARALIERGFKRVRPLEGGLDRWIEAGYEVAIGAGEGGDAGDDGRVLAAPG